MLHQLVRFFKGALVKKQVQALAGRKLAIQVLAVQTLLASACLCLRMPPAQLFDFLLKGHRLDHCHVESIADYNRHSSAAGLYHFALRARRRVAGAGQLSRFHLD